MNCPSHTENSRHENGEATEQLGVPLEYAAMTTSAGIQRETLCPLGDHIRCGIPERSERARVHEQRVEFGCRAWFAQSSGEFLHD